MQEITAEDRKIVREIILGYFELFENKSFTRQHVYDIALADRDMPRIEDKQGVVAQEFDQLLLETRIRVVGGSGEKELIQLKPVRYHR